MKNFLTEFVGTFFLVLTIGLTAASGTPMAPLVIGQCVDASSYQIDYGSCTSGRPRAGTWSPALGVHAHERYHDFSSVGRRTAMGP